MSDYKNFHTGPNDDPFSSDEWRDMERRATAELIPKMESCGTIVQLVPLGQTDVKFAMELGLSIMLDKPIIALVKRGHQVPEKLLKIADEIIVYDDLMGIQEKVYAAVERLDAQS